LVVANVTCFGTLATGSKSSPPLRSFRVKVRGDIPPHKGKIVT